MALVSRDLVRAFTAGVKTIFDEAFQAQMGVWNALATLTPSSQATEEYAWLSELPVMREWTDERTIKALKEYGFTIRNRKFETTIGVDREVIEDERYGQVKMRVQSLAEAAAMHYDRLLFDLINAGETAKCYDAQPFYASAHPVGEATVANKTDLPLTADNLATVLGAMSKIPLENGEPMMVSPTHLLVHPVRRFEARRILNSAYYPDEVTGVGAMAKNPLQGELILVTSARLTTEAEWHVFDCSHPVRPFLIQQRVPPTFEALDGADGDSEAAFLRDQYLYGVRSRDEAGFGPHEPVGVM